MLKNLLLLYDRRSFIGNAPIERMNIVAAAAAADQHGDTRQGRQSPKQSMTDRMANARPHARMNHAG
jgi:hypothetical protein